jgi:hypothetical protein
LGGGLVHRGRLQDLPERLLAQRDGLQRTFSEHPVLATLAAFGKWGFDYLALLCVLAGLDLHPAPALVLLAYSASALLGMIPITPGGLGFVEAGLTGLLVLAGLSAGDAAAATLAYRLVSYWLPLPVGVVAWICAPALRNLRSGRRAERVDHDVVELSREQLAAEWRQCGPKALPVDLLYEGEDGCMAGLELLGELLHRLVADAPVDRGEPAAAGQAGDRARDRNSEYEAEEQPDRSAGDEALAGGQLPRLVEGDLPAFELHRHRGVLEHERMLARERLQARERALGRRLVPVRDGEYVRAHGSQLLARESTPLHPSRVMRAPVAAP